MVPLHPTGSKRPPRLDRMRRSAEHRRHPRAGMMFSSSSRHRPYRVATLGFTDFERSALASFFRLAERRVPAYVQVETDDDHDFLVADADQPRVLARVARERRTADTVFIGEQAPDDALAWLTRPIEPIHIMRALDALLGGRRGAEPTDAPSGSTVPARRPADTGDTASGTSPGAATRPVPLPGANRRVLVANGDETARGALQLWLAELGYRVSVAVSGEEALESADWTAFDIAFVDLNLRETAGPDGLQLCQALKKRRQGEQPPRAPVVVITTADANPTDKVRGMLAGCDAYLTQPLREAKFKAMLDTLDPGLSETR